MPQLVDIELDLAGLSGVTEDPTESAFSRSAEQIRDVVIDQVSQSLGMSRETIKESGLVGSFSDENDIVIYGRDEGGISLVHLDPRQTSEGVEYTNPITSGREIRENAFIIEKFGGEVFTRVGEDRFPLDKERFPKDEEMGDEFWGDVIADLDRAAIVDAFTDELEGALSA